MHDCPILKMTVSDIVTYVKILLNTFIIFAEHVYKNRKNDGSAEPRHAGTGLKRGPRPIHIYAKTARKSRKPRRKNRGFPE